MKKLATFLALFFALQAAFAQPFAIGHKQQTFTDASRSNRSIATEIYYPATSDGDNTPLASGQYPVLVFGHGFVMTWDAYDVVWEALVPQGYILVFPKTEGSFSPSHGDFGRDLAYLVGAMKGEGAASTSFFYNAISDKSAVMGHSMGGGAAFLAVQHDSSITAIATLAAAETNPSAIAAAASVSIPALVLAAGNDCVTPPSQHQIPIYDALASACKTYISINGGSHCRFAGSSFTCSFGESTCTPAPTTSAATQQQLAFGALLPWLNAHLKSDASASADFQTLLANGSGITSQQSCTVAPTALQRAFAPTFAAYPNPWRQTLTLEFAQPQHEAKIRLYNTIGQEVRQIQGFSGQTLQLQRGELPAGMYRLRVETAQRAAIEQAILVE